MPGVAAGADLGARFLGYLIDVLISMPLAGLAAIPIVGIFVAPLLCLYWLSRDSFFDGQSIGKRIVKTRVVRLNGAPITWGQSALRNLWSLPMILFMIPFMEEFVPAVVGIFGTLDVILVLIAQRRLGDHLAQTIIVREN